MAKKFDNDAAVQVAEEAFRAGFRAAAGFSKDPYCKEENEAWNEFEPAQDIKDLVD